MRRPACRTPGSHQGDQTFGLDHANNVTSKKEKRPRPSCTTMFDCGALFGNIAWRSSLSFLSAGSNGVTCSADDTMEQLAPDDLSPGSASSDIRLTSFKKVGARC